MEKSRLNKNLTFIFLLAFLIQFIHINIGFSVIKPYMLVSIVFLFSSRIKIRKFMNYELFWLISFVVIMFSSLYAKEKVLAFQVVIGQIILVGAFIIYRFLVNGISIESFESVFCKVGKFFVYFSFGLYLIGIVSFYILKISPPESAYLNDHALRIYGLYLEGTFPRLMGLAETPNNYAYYASLFLWFFDYKKERRIFYITILTLLLTISTSAILVLVIQSIVYFLYIGKKVFFRIFISSLFFSSLIVCLYNSNEAIKSIIDYRMARNMSGSGRFELWDYVWELIVNSPILGYGANQSRVVIAPFRVLMSSHNSIIEMILTAGLIGGIIYILFLFFLIHRSYLLSKKYSTPLFTLLSISFVMFGLSNNTLHIDYVVFYLGFLSAYKLNMSVVRNNNLVLE